MPKYLNQDNKTSLTAERISEYPLPYDSEVLVRVKSLSIGRMNKYNEASSKGGERAKLEAYHLIADSIVDEVGEPIWVDSSEVRGLANADTRLVASLIKMIGKHNGGSDDDIEEMEKNLDETD